MKKLTLIGITLTLWLGLALWHEQLLVAKAAPMFATTTVINNNDSGAGSLRQAIACSSGTPDPIEETATAGTSSLSYDATTDRYTYVWKTEQSWRGTCRKLIVMFTDGTTREALFQFR